MISHALLGFAFQALLGLAYQAFFVFAFLLRKLCLLCRGARLIF
tara:strand:+ start:388 stop:519 length:132 start_codon:yes stop_codon:yes gene_type:complete